MPSVYRFVHHAGPVPEGHAGAECPECDGEGRFEVQLAARCTDLEPHYREELCGCEEGRLEELECDYCGTWLVSDDGVGAIVEQVQENGRRSYSTLCGPCAWAEIVEDDDDDLYAA